MARAERYYASRWQPRIARAGLWLLLLVAVGRLPALWTSTAARLDAAPWGHRQVRVGTPSAFDGTLIDEADARLPRDARVVVLTPGRDPRRTEYIAFHRARYQLAPRPTWWITSAPRDGTSESRWWVADPLTPESIRAFAESRGITYGLVLGEAVTADLGVPIVERSGGRLVRLRAGTGSIPEAPAFGATHAGAAALPSLVAGLAGIFGLGLAMRMAMSPIRAPGGWWATAADSWWLGSIALSVSLFWLDRWHVSPAAQRLGCSAIAVGAAAGALAWRRGWRRDRDAGARPPDTAREPDAAWPRGRLARGLATAVIAANGVSVAALAIGRPLEAWDSWTVWTLRARAIFREGGIGGAVTGDATALSPHLGYPLAVPLRQAWVFGWIGAPDDRWVGILAAFDYATMLALVWLALRATRDGTAARVSTAVAAAVVPLAAGAAAAMADITIALLAVAGLSHLLRWERSGAKGDLALAALAIGAMPWFKIDGGVLAVVIVAGAVALIRPPGRALAMVATTALAWVAVALAWSLERPRALQEVADFAPLTGAGLLAGLDRAWPIARQTALILVHPLLGFIWPVTGLVVAAASMAPGARRGHPHRAEALPLMVAVAFAAAMTLPYLLSTYAPLEAHIRNSYYRLAAQVTPLLALWLGVRAAGEESR